MGRKKSTPEQEDDKKKLYIKKINETQEIH